MLELERDRRLPLLTARLAVLFALVYHRLKRSRIAYIAVRFQWLIFTRYSNNFRAAMQRYDSKREISTSYASGVGLVPGLAPGQFDPFPSSLSVPTDSKGTVFDSSFDCMASSHIRSHS